MYGAANVTQHRVKAVVSYGTTEIVTKYSVVYDEVNKLVKFDIAEAARSVLPIVQTLSASPWEITKITNLTALSDPSQKEITIDFTEQYYLSGVFTSSATITRAYQSLRGFTDGITIVSNKHKYGNWWQLNGLSNFMPFSGKVNQVYPMRAEDDAWVTPAVDAYLGIRLYKNTDLTPTITYSALRDKAGILYFPIYLAGTTDQDDFLYWKVVVATETTPGAATHIYDIFEIHKNVDDCEGESETIMFQDRLQTWAFMHFPKKKRITVNTTGIQGELIETADKPGRFKYNVEASDILELSTDWMQEEQNPLIQDLISTESAWLVDPSDGSLEQVTVVPNSVRLKTRWVDNMIMYTMSFRKSLNNFKP